MWFVHYMCHELPPWHDSDEELLKGKPCVEGPYDLDKALTRVRELNSEESCTSGAYLDER
jgi:hypothetical protein